LGFGAMAEAEAKVKLSKDYALSILLPTELKDVVEPFRKAHDKAKKTWPAHINLFHPFVPNIYDAQYKVEEILQKTKKFDISFTGLTFSQSKSKSKQGKVYIFLELECPELITLQSEILKKFPS